MPAKLQEIEGRYIGEKFRFGDCLVGSINHGEGIMTIKGDAEQDEMIIGATYRFFGRFSDYTNRRTRVTEKQFHFQTFVSARAHDKAGVVAYLESAGKGNGVGTGTARKLWDAFGPDAIRTIREDPGKLQEINGRITDEQAETIKARLDHQSATEDATIELTNLLHGRGFPKTTARKTIKRWGNRAAQVIQRDPYALMAFRGCGFKLCDSLWIELGLSPHRLRRQALCAWYSIASNTEGHTWHSVENVARAVQQEIGSTRARPAKAIELATRLGRMSPDHYGALAILKTDGRTGPVVDGGKNIWLAQGRKAESERNLAGWVASAIDEARPREVTRYESKEISWEEAVEAIKCQRCSQRLTAPQVHVWNGKPFGPTCIGYISDGTDVDVLPLADWVEQQPPRVRSIIQDLPAGTESLPGFSLWPDPQEVKGIDGHQREKLTDALISRVAILGGSPGTGKTFATAMLVKHLLDTGTVGPHDIAIGCPTGKAAVRITEAMQAAVVPLKARTWHSLLGVGKSDEDGGEWGFLHNQANPWQYRIIIGDESSMLDASLMASIFAARPRGCHVLLVGDINQLPPVGHGAPLRDLIASQAVGYGELTEIKRNSGGIVEACASIRDGKPWGEGSNLIIKSVSPEDQIGCLVEGLHGANESGVDPVWDCQVLVAVNARSKLSRKEINQHLQDVLNDSPEVKGTPFRLNDKIVCLQNGRYTALEADEEARDEDDGNEVYVANGELAKVIEIEDKSMIAELWNPSRTVRIPRGKPKDDGESSGAGCAWDLAYALSVHKSQGSEWPVVFVMLDEYPGARMVCDRSWIYTAISRAKSKCLLIGKKAAADAMCRREKIGKRKTFLRERIQIKANERILESI